MSRLPQRYSAGVLLVITLMILAGCDAAAYVLNAFEDDRIPAQHQLAQTPVLILVDDPQYKLGDPSLASLAAAWAGDGIRKNVSKTPVIAQQKLQDLAQSKGDGFASMPVDQVGAALGAGQVVYVSVESAGITGDIGLYRPQAVVRVNVIDVSTGKRVFPAGVTDATSASQGVPQRGQRVEVKLHYTSSEQSPLGETAVLMRTLAQEVGTAVGELFYKHHPKPVPTYEE